MLLMLFSLEAHSRMSFSMILKMLKKNCSQYPSTKVWILKVSFILKSIEYEGLDCSIYKYLISRDKYIAENEC
jgi:hypothetical protein